MTSTQEKSDPLSGLSERTGSQANLLDIVPIEIPQAPIPYIPELESTWIKPEQMIPRAVVGESAPHFEVMAYHNLEWKKVTLNDFKGKYLILVFFPAQFNYAEIEALSEEYSKFAELDCEVVGVAPKGQIGDIDFRLLKEIEVVKVVVPEEEPEETSEVKQEGKSPLKESSKTLRSTETSKTSGRKTKNSPKKTK